jgi:hypothetical protein
MPTKSANEPTIRLIRVFGRLPAFPLFVALCVSLTVVYFSFSPTHHWRHSGGLSSSTRNHEIPSYTPAPHGKKQKAGQIRVCEAPRTNVWNELSENDVEDVIQVYGRLGIAIGIPEGSEM